MSLNQRVPGSSPGAPTIAKSGTYRRLLILHSDKLSQRLLRQTGCFCSLLTTFLGPRDELLTSAFSLRIQAAVTHAGAVAQASSDFWISRSRSAMSRFRARNNSFGFRADSDEPSGWAMPLKATSTSTLASSFGDFRPVGEYHQLVQLAMPRILNRNHSPADIPYQLPTALETALLTDKSFRFYIMSGLTAGITGALKDLR
jgi:hypothetical protein